MAATDRAGCSADDAIPRFTPHPCIPQRGQHCGNCGRVSLCLSRGGTPHATDGRPTSGHPVERERLEGEDSRAW
eukprot:2246716-Prymnesium_polylepis.1